MVGIGVAILGQGEVWANCSIRSGNLEVTPDANFTDNGNGTVTHTTTGLMWKTCPEGRTYSGGSCVGTTASYTWQATLRRAVSDTTAGNTDWRLPSRTELLSIVETGCSGTTINTTRFPNMPSSGLFWTSTHAGPAANDSAWAVRFTTGSSLLTTKGSSAYARLVRSGNTVHDTYRATPPTEPAAFTFTSQLATPGATVTSNIVTMSGLTAARNISITGGQYRINGGAWTAANGTIANGNTLQLSVVAPYTVPSSASATVNVNGRTATFLVTTGTPPPDSVPDNFAFTDQTGVFPLTLTTSNSISVSGINQAIAISITNGEYEKNSSGSWTSIAGTVVNGDTVTVRHTSSASYSTAVNTVLTIGGISDTFTSTTGALDTTPNAFTFTDQTSVALSTLMTSNSITVAGINGAASISVTNGEYEKNASGSWTSAAGGTVVNGDTVKVRHTSSASYSTAVNTTLTINGNVSDIFTSTTAALDTTPDAFTFTDQTGVTLSTLTTSNSITVAGINSAISISVSGGEYEKNASGSWTSAAGGTVVNGDTVKVRHASSASYSTAVNTLLTIGSVSDTFTSTTQAAPGDTVPDAFSFTDQTPVALSTLTASNTLTVSGISAAASIGVTNGEYQINGGAWTAVAGSITNGQTFAVRHTSSATELTAVNTTLNIGGVTDIFTTTTGDKTPAAYTFTDQTPVALSTLTTSDTLTVSGITIPTSISVSGGEYQIAGGAFTTSAGTISNGQTFAVRHTSSASQTTATNTTLTIGGTVSDTFTTTTGDSIPTAFTFTDETNVPVSTLKTSNSITVADITIPAAISVTGGTYNINGGAYTSSAGTVSNGNTVTVQHTSSASNSTATNTVLTIGTISDTYTTTTAAPACGTAPNPPLVNFTTLNNQQRGVTVQSNTQTVQGVCNGTSVTVAGHTSARVSINGGAYVTSGTINAGQTVRLQMTSNSNSNSTRTITLTVGTGPAVSWTVNSD